MEELKTSANNFELSPKNINKDLIHFKNDILKDIRAIKLSFAEKYSILEENLKEKMNNYDLTIKSFEQKIIELTKLITIDKSIKEKVDSLNEFKEETRDNIFKQRAKFNEFETRITKELDNINNILLDSVIYPGIIGGNSKFKTFHDYIDFTLKEISELSLIKDKNGMDLKPFKKKIEQNIDAFRIQINNMYTKEMTNNAINKTEERLQSLFKLYDEKIMNLKVENLGSNENYINKIKEINSKLNSLEKLRQNLEYDFEIKNIKKEIKKIYEILRDIFTFPEIKKETEKKNQIYSGVKQYINGYLNADQLTSMKKFSYGKSNSNNKILDKHNSANISPFPTPEKIKTKNSFERKKLFSNNDLNNNDFLLESKISNSFKENNLKEKENVFISQKGIFVNHAVSRDINDISSKKKIINKKIEDEYKKSDEIINSEKNNVLKNINLDTRIKKIYKEEEKIINRLNSYENSNSKKLLEKNDTFIISEEDENIISDNTNLLKDKKNKAENGILKENIKNYKVISFNNSKKNIAQKNSNNINNKTKKENEKQKEGYLGQLNISKDINNIYSQNKNILNSMKKLKEKEYNQSVPVLEIKREKKPEIKLLNSKENVGTQSEESQFFKRNQNSKIFGNKTYTYFPHIKKENPNEKEKKVKIKKNSAFDNKNNFIKLKASNNSLLYNDENIQYNQNYYIKKPKKVLLINPDSISNYELRKNNKSARNKNNKNGIGFNTQKNLDKMADEMIKGFIDKKKNKIIVNGGKSYQMYNSLYDIITAYEKTYGQNQNSKKYK